MTTRHWASIAPYYAGLIGLSLGGAARTPEQRATDRMVRAIDNLDRIRGAKERRRARP